MSFKVGKQYLLVIPESWRKYDKHSETWHNQIVTYKKTGTNWDAEEVDYDCSSQPIEPFTAWVTCSGLTTNHISNVFLALPEWLREPYVSPITGEFR